MKFTLTYDIESRGWARSALQCNGESYVIDSISYLSDAFLGLSQAVWDLLNGAKSADCSFDHEPGRTKLRFTVDGDSVLIHVYEFDNELIDKPWDEGRCVQVFQTRLLRLKSQYLQVADGLLERFGAEKYEQRWGYPFPIELYKRVKTSKS